VLTDAEVRAAVVREWGLTGATVTPHHGGMNSATWFVSDAGGAVRWVAKSVPAAAASAFAGGLRVAAHVDRAGIPAGAAVPASGGRDVVTVDGDPLALLGLVPGEPLGPPDQRVVGATLAAAHRALAGVPADGAERFHWVDPTAAHLAVRDWIRPAVTAAVRDLDTSAMTWGLLHTDPEPEAFRLDPETRVCGILDWSVALHGPLLYDLASAVMYVGGPALGQELISSYLDGGTLSAAEVRAGLMPMLRFRWAVQADYFARRVVTRDLTGITGDEGNEIGLEHARIALTSTA
jgi:Ser/Thr protein kinase RdoA (MazF antagonist)